MHVAELKQRLVLPIVAAPLSAPRKPALPNDLKSWRDIWSAGHGVGLIDDVPDVAALVQRLKSEYEAASH